MFPWGLRDYPSSDSGLTKAYSLTLFFRAGYNR